MAFCKTGSMMLAVVAVASAAQFTMRHEHWQDYCTGILTVDKDGVSFAGPKKHKWTWKYADIQELKLSPERIYVLTYADNKLLLGTDRGYNFTGQVPVADVRALAWSHLDRRFVAAFGEPREAALWSLPVKHQLRISGTEGTLSVFPDRIVYATTGKDDSRTWRYSDIESISSSGPYQLTITSFERALSHYGDRKGFNFQLKEPITEARYNELWMEIERKNGRVQ